MLTKLLIGIEHCSRTSERKSDNNKRRAMRMTGSNSFINRVGSLVSLGA